MPNTFGLGTDTTGFSSTVVKLVNRKIIETLRSGLTFLPAGAVVPAVQKKGYNGTFVHVAYPDLPFNTTNLTEGVPPSPLKLGIDTIEFSAVQKGQYVEITDLANMESPHDLTAVASDKIARQMAETADELARLVWAGHATDLFSGGGDSSDDVGGADGLLSAVDVMDAVALLRERNVEPFAGGDYLAIASPRALRGLGVDDRFVTAAKYGDPSRLFKGSIGGFEGVQFVTSSRATVNDEAGTAIIAAGATTVEADDDIFTTTTAHGLAAGDKVRITAMTGGTGATVGTAYFVIAGSLAATTFKLSATDGGASLAITADGSGITFGEAVDTYETYVIGKNSIAFGDLGTLQVIVESGGVSDPLHQLETVGWKAFLGGVLISMSETSDGAGANDATVDRIVTIESSSGMGTATA